MIFGAIPRVVTTYAQNLCSFRVERVKGDDTTCI